MTTAEDIYCTLEQMGDERLARNLSRFFKTGKGDYGEGDRFLGLSGYDMHQNRGRMAAVSSGRRHDARPWHSRTPPRTGTPILAQTTISHLSWKDGFM